MNYDFAKFWTERFKLNWLNCSLKELSLVLKFAKRKYINSAEDQQTWYLVMRSCFICSNLRFSSFWRSPFFCARPTYTCLPLSSLPFMSSTACNTPNVSRGCIDSKPKEKVDQQISDKLICRIFEIEHMVEQSKRSRS